MEQHVFGEIRRAVQIAAGDALLEGDLLVPAGAAGLVAFVHGSGSSRLSPRNVSVATVLQSAGVGTLLFDLLTREEEDVDRHTSMHRFDIGLLANRLIGATRWIDAQRALRELRIGYFGASTGSAAALIAAATLPERVSAVVSRGGRPDLADATTLSRVAAPTLLIVGGHDELVIELNHRAFEQLHCEKHLAIVPGASHLFEEPGALESVATLASDWFRRHLGTGV